ncbi:MAG: hypothetical protein GY755_11325 [Chloroflexi bacterium]|nr:hypothetical protein [Chloroflexota bacterium]
MQLKDVRDAYYGYSGKASDGARQASFAGIAIIWIFKSQEGVQFAIPDELALPLVFFISSLAADLLHYILGSVIWGTYNQILEKRHGVNFEGKLEAPTAINLPTLFFFSAKLILVFIGYILLFKFGFNELGMSGK